MNASSAVGIGAAPAVQKLPAIQLADVAKSYGTFRRRPALQDVSLRIERGECYGLAGPNGAGKTTLIKIMLGLVAPDAGEARLFGCRPELPDVRRRVGFVPEAAELPHGATPLQLVRRWARLRGLKVSAAAEEGEHHLVRLGMKDLLRRPAHRLSKGERQRTLLSLALLGSPDLLVLDEPTDGLDPLGRALMRRVIEEECAAGRTVFLNSHLLSETERLCTRVGILHRGRLVREEVLTSSAGADDEAGSTAIRLREPLANSDTAELGLKAGHDGRYRLEHRNLNELNLTIDRLRARGAVLVEVERLQVNLEDALAEVASGDIAANVSEIAELEEAPQPPISPLRPARAVIRVARELAADLVARRVLHVGLAGALLFLAALVYISHEEVAAGLAAGSRLLQKSADPTMVRSITTGITGNMALGAYWILLIGGTFLAAFFAPPVLDARRILLLHAQPVSRGDVAAGIYLAVCTITLAIFLAFDGLLFGAFRFLGAAVPSSFLLAGAVTALAFAALYTSTLLATYAFPNGLFAGLIGVTQLILFSVLNSLPAGQLGKSHGLGGFLLGIAPRLVDLGFVARSFGGGSHIQSFPLLATAVWSAALVLVLNMVARRSER
jgi:ABC-2 type transport system ATP-binding protein